MIPTSGQINLQAAKTNYERELATKEEQAEELRRNLTKQVRELEGLLDEERKQRQTAQSAQKKLESELQDLENQVEAEAKGKEDAQRHYKKLHVSPGVSLSLLLSPFSLYHSLSHASI